MNIMNTIMGIAILSLPSTFKALGIVFGAFILIMMMLFHDCICRIMIKLKNATGHVNYTSIGMDTVKHCWIKIAIKSTMVLLCFGVCILNLGVFNAGLQDIVIKIEGVSETEDFLGEFCSKKYYVVPIVSILFIPLLIVKNTEKLSYLGYVSVSGTLVFIVCLFIAFGKKVSDNVIDYSEIGWFITKDPGSAGLIGIFKNIPTATMAFTFQFNYFAYYKDLKDVTDKKMNKVTLRSLVSVCTLYLCIGICGYLIFGNKLEANILDNFIAEYKYFGKGLVITLVVSYLFVAGLSFPIIFFTCRNFILSIIQDIRNSKKDADVVVIHETKQIAEAISAHPKDIKLTRSAFFDGQKIKEINITNKEKSSVARKIRKTSNYECDEKIKETEEELEASARDIGLKEKLIDDDLGFDREKGDEYKNILAQNRSLLKEEQKKIDVQYETLSPRLKTQD